MTMISILKTSTALPLLTDICAPVRASVVSAGVRAKEAKLHTLLREREASKRAAYDELVESKRVVNTDMGVAHGLD